MTVASILRKIESYGVTLAIHDGNLKLRGEQSAVNAILALVRDNKTAIITELTGGPLGASAPAIWQCPSGYARHHEFWMSDYGLKICAICHPGPAHVPLQGGAA